MPKCLIVYFSQGGTTERVAGAIAAGLKTAGYSVDLHNLRQVKPPDTAGYDLLGIGTPVYGYTIPFNVADYLSSLPELKDKSGFSFLLHGTFAFDAGNHLRRALAKKQVKVVGYFDCHGEDYFLGYLRRGYLFSPEHPTAVEMKQAELFGKEIAARANGQPYSPPEFEKAAPLIYRAERFFGSRWFVRNFYTRLFSVDKKTCTSCGLCSRLCPSRNIQPDKEGRPLWDRGCLFCLTCEMKCPGDAIKSVLDLPFFTPFMRYNVNHAASDPSLECVRVRHVKGRTERI